MGCNALGQVCSSVQLNQESPTATRSNTLYNSTVQLASNPSEILGCTRTKLLYGVLWVILSRALLLHGCAKASQEQAIHQWMVNNLVEICGHHECWAPLKNQITSVPKAKEGFAERISLYFLSVFHLGHGKVAFWLRPRSSNIFRPLTPLDLTRN